MAGNWQSKEEYKKVYDAFYNDYILKGFSVEEAQKKAADSTNTFMDGAAEIGKNIDKLLKPGIGAY